VLFLTIDNLEFSKQIWPHFCERLASLGAINNLEFSKQIWPNFCGLGLSPNFFLWLSICPPTSVVLIMFFLSVLSISRAGLPSFVNFLGGSRVKFVSLANELVQVMTYHTCREPAHFCFWLGDTFWIHFDSP
jgi:hypothetical protein